MESVYIVLMIAVAGATLVVLGTAIRRHRTRSVRMWLDEYKLAKQQGCLHEMQPVPEGPGSKWPAVAKAQKEIQAAQAKIEAAARSKQQEEAQRAKNAEQYQQRRQAATRQVRQLRMRKLTASDLDEVGKLYDSVRLLNPEDAAWLRETLALLVTQYTDALLTQARDGDAQAFHQLRAFVFPANYCPYVRYTGKPYSFPDDWDDLLSIYVKNPVLADFCGVKKGLTVGDCALLAAEAVRTQSLRLGALVLAYCKETVWLRERGKHYRWRDEVGDTLFAEVTLMVERIQAEQPAYRNTTK